MRKAIQQYLHRGFPLLHAGKQGRWSIAGVAILIALLINIQQPFGLRDWYHPFKWFVLSGFGAIYAMVACFYYTFFQVKFPHMLHAGAWTVGKEILLSLIVVVTAGVINWCYALATISYSTFTLASFARVQYETLTFGLMPVLIHALSAESLSNHHDRPLAGNENGNIYQRPPPPPSTDLIRINGVSLMADNIHYIEASQNYVYIHHTQNGNEERLFCRTTFKNVESMLASYPRFVRCHRSFIVNTDKLQKVRGNALGLKLSLINCHKEITVSRFFIPKFRSAISKN